MPVSGMDFGAVCDQVDALETEAKTSDGAGVGRLPAAAPGMRFETAGRPDYAFDVLRETSVLF